MLFRIGAAVIEILAALLPTKYWSRVESAWNIQLRPGLSAVAGLALGVYVGIPAFIAHVANSAKTATSLVLGAAAEQLRHPVKHEVSSTLTQALTLFSMVTFLASPVGLFASYCVASSLLRIACVFVGDAIGDPALTAVDGFVRWIAATASLTRGHIIQRVRFGRAVGDRMTNAAALGIAEADVAILSSRPKPGWTIGTMVLAGDECYRIVNVKESPFDGRRWIAYLLCKKTDSEILRRTVQYVAIRT